ncbi:hypothetical protein GCM10009557_68500 [Virgisporangium ochraceum]
MTAPLLFTTGERENILRNHDVAPTPARRRHARRIEPHLLLAELTDAQVSDLRRQYAGRAVIAPDAPMSPFCS